MSERSRLVVVSRKFGYNRHQGDKEKRRRLNQIRAGILNEPKPTTGPLWRPRTQFLSQEARYAAFGFYKV